MSISRKIVYASKRKSLEKLQNPSAGYAPSEVLHIVNLLKDKLGPQVKNLMTGFLNDVPPDSKDIEAHSKEKFKLFVRNMGAPARYYIPLGVRDHMLGCIVNLDKAGKATILIFDPLGSDGYKKSYQFFIDELENRFPHPTIIKTTTQFQDLQKGDKNCGAWALWFLEEASAKQDLTLEEIKNHFEHMTPPEYGRDLRQKHINLLRDDIEKNPSAADKSPFEMEIKPSSSDEETIEMEALPEDEPTTEAPPLNEAVAEKLAKALLDIFEKLQLLLGKIELELDRLIKAQKKESKTANTSPQASASSLGKFGQRRVVGKNHGSTPTPTPKKPNT